MYSRVMWKMASQAKMLERKALPKPWPEWAPFTKPAISTTFRNAGTLLKERWREIKNTVSLMTKTMLVIASCIYAPGWFMVLAEKVKTLIWNGHTALIWVDGAKRKILSRCLTLCQNIEECWLSGEKKTHRLRWKMWNFVLHNEQITMDQREGVFKNLKIKKKV